MVATRADLNFWYGTVCCFWDKTHGFQGWGIGSIHVYMGLVGHGLMMGRGAEVGGGGGHACENVVPHSFI